MKLDIEKAAEEYSKQFYGLPEDHSMSDFTAGANYALEQLSQQLASAKEQLKKSISFESHLEWKREWEQQLAERDAEIANLETKLKRAIEQRNDYIGNYTTEYLKHDIKTEIALADEELASITAESIRHLSAKTEESK